MPLKLSDIQTLANKFAEQNIADWVKRIQSFDLKFDQKEINDPVWGTITLSPVEVAILDSPLIQRLRTISQLGVVHWVYPGAVHTRFEHTLGVLHQTQTLIQAINRIAGTAPSAPLIDESLQNTLRTAALVHDTGHGAFSHVSEFALLKHADLMSIVTDFSEEHRCEERHFSEIFSYYLVLSPAFKSLMEELYDRCGPFVQFHEKKSRNLDALVKNIAKTIIGKRISDKIPIIHEIVSGPFDADKLDYFVRDATNAGTPIVIDISRLIQKLTVRRFSAHELPKNISSNVSAQREDYYLFGVKWSGIPVLDELHLARILLFSKVYKHAKVSAIEQMVSLAIECLMKAFPVRDVIEFLYHNSDDSILHFTERQLLVTFLDDIKPSGSQLVYIKQYTSIIQALKDRQLHMKAFQIQRIYPSQDSNSVHNYEDGINDFIDEIEHPGRREVLKERIVDELFRVLEKLKIKQAPKRDDILTMLSIVPTGSTPGGTQIGRAYVIPDTGRPIAFREYFVNRSAWADSYFSDQPRGYVFSESWIADLVFICIERILRTDYDVRLPAEALETSKRNRKKIESFKLQMADKGLFRGVPYDIRATPKRLLRADVQPRLQELQTKLAPYEVPVQREAASVSAVDEARIFDWLRQFETDSRIECALRCLESIKMLRRGDTVAAVREFIQENPEFRGSPVIGFGSARDSGAIQAYFSGDLEGGYVSRISRLSDEAHRSPAPERVILLDDFIGSGGQAQDILAAGLGVESLRKDLGESRELFDEVEAGFLRSTQLGFVFTAGWRQGIETIKRALADLNLSGVVYCKYLDADIPFFKLTSDESIKQSEIEDFEKFCRSVGMEILSSGRKKNLAPSDNDAGKIEERCFGYGNRGMLLVSPFNTPTQTLTLLWCGGVFREVEWMPLLPRRKKT